LFLPGSEEPCLGKPGFGCIHLHGYFSKSLRFWPTEVVSGEISSNAVTFQKAPLSVFLPGFYHNTCMIIKVTFVTEFIPNSGSCEPYISMFHFSMAPGSLSIFHRIRSFDLLPVFRFVSCCPDFHLVGW